MATIKITFLVERKRADGSPSFLWQPYAKLRQAGWKIITLSDNRAEAINQAHWMNRLYQHWRDRNTAALLDLQRAWATQDSAAIKSAGLARVPFLLPHVPGLPAPETLERTARDRTIADLVTAFKASRDFADKAKKTQSDYRSKMNRIGDDLGDTPVAAITRRVVRTFYSTARADTHDDGTEKHAMANGLVRVLSVLLSFAVDEEWISENPAFRIKMKTVPPRLRLVTFRETHALVAAADALGLPSVGDAIIAAADLGLRRSDLCAMPARILEGHSLTIKTAKTGTLVSLIATDRLIARIEESRRRLKQQHNLTGGKITSTALLVTEDGTAWVPDNLTKAFAEVRAEAARTCPSVEDAKFLDLRDTAVTNLHRAGNDLPRITAVTGHSMRSALTILKHYLVIDEDLSAEAINRLNTYIKEQESLLRA